MTRQRNNDGLEDYVCEKEKIEKYIYQTQKLLRL